LLIQIFICQTEDISGEPRQAENQQGHKESETQDGMIQEEDIQRDRHGQTASTKTQSLLPTSNDTPSQYTLNQRQKVEGGENAVENRTEDVERLLYL